ncbi:MAG: hypothetical protein HC828_17145, partial [Blastochloris sp.]|nr:hypothetical protein [Blastochloris sp.]
RAASRSDRCGRDRSRDDAHQRRRGAGRVAAGEGRVQAQNFTWELAARAVLSAVDRL